MSNQQSFIVNYSHHVGDTFDSLPTKVIDGEARKSYL